MRKPGHTDAGIHLGQFFERDTIVVRVSPDQRAAIVGAPSYFNARQKPVRPLLNELQPAHK